MATIAKLAVTNAKQLDGTNWATVRDPFGPLDVPTSDKRGDCIVEAQTLPDNKTSEWLQINWKGGEAVLGIPNQRQIGRQDSGKIEIEASIGADKKRMTLWVIWAELKILTSGPRPALAKPWSAGALFSGPDQCGAFEVESWSMGKNARGQVVAVASVFPAGIGQFLNGIAKNDKWALRRQVTAHDFADGVQVKHKKSFVPWFGDDSIPGMQTLAPATNDQLYDTDGPDLPTGLNTAETYNNFRQWVEWDGTPCSSFAHWHFQARWKARAVTLKDVGPGEIQLPAKPFYK